MSGVSHRCSERVAQAAAASICGICAARCCSSMQRPPAQQCVVPLDHACNARAVELGGAPNEQEMRGHFLSAAAQDRDRTPSSPVTPYWRSKRF
jgi:hypothetical protein